MNVSKLSVRISFAANSPPIRPLFPRAGDLGRGGFVVPNPNLKAALPSKPKLRAVSGVLSSRKSRLPITSSRLTPITRTRPRLLAALQVDGGSESQGIIICPETLTARITAFHFD
jgi:hypothetical protein